MVGIGGAECETPTDTIRLSKSSAEMDALSVSFLADCNGDIYHHYWPRGGGGRGRRRGVGVEGLKRLLAARSWEEVEGGEVCLVSFTKERYGSARTGFAARRLEDFVPFWKNGSIALDEGKHQLNILLNVESHEPRNGPQLCLKFRLNTLRSTACERRHVAS